MQYNATTPKEYLSALEDDWRKEKLLQLREIIHAKAPDIKEGVQYKMLCFGDGAKTIFHLNAQKNYVSLYVGDTRKIDKYGELLEGLKTGKGCIRFSKSVSIAHSRIDEFIERTISLWRSGKDIDC